MSPARTPAPTHPQRGLLREAPGPELFPSAPPGLAQTKAQRRTVMAQSFLEFGLGVRGGESLTGTEPQFRSSSLGTHWCFLAELKRPILVPCFLTAASPSLECSALAGGKLAACLGQPLLRLFSFPATFCSGFLLSLTECQSTEGPGRASTPAPFLGPQFAFPHSLVSGIPYFSLDCPRFPCRLS